MRETLIYLSHLDHDDTERQVPFTRDVGIQIVLILWNYLLPFSLL